MAERPLPPAFILENVGIFGACELCCKTVSDFPELPCVICLLDTKKEGGGREKRDGRGRGKEPAGKGGEREERHLADVKDDHPLQDNCTWFLSHPLPLIY